MASEYIKVRRANCKNCYKCLKSCLVQAIIYKNDMIEVQDEACILCGSCITACPQRAKNINNNVEIVKEFLADESVVTVASLAPSFISAFGENSHSMVWAIKQLGFDYVEETSVGAAYVTQEYKRLMEKGEQEIIISSACPSINIYIQKYYPELTKYIAPVMSPLLVHAKMLKEKYGKNARVVYIGTCLAQLKEVRDSGNIDAMITFNQLSNLLMFKGISPQDGEVIPFDAESSYSRIYPINDGIIYDIRKSSGNALGTEKICGYDMISSSGMHNVKKLLDEVHKGNIKHAFLEMFSCYGGCVHGPFKTSLGSTSYRARIDVKNYADEAKPIELVPIGDISKKFEPTPFVQDMPSEEQIRAILAQIGKNSRAQELNCGSCGYPTCRDKAIAVYQGKAELYICLPYMTDINQALSNVTLSLTPNYIIAVDSDLYIKEFNVAAQKLFKISRLNALNQKLSMFIDTTNFEQAIANKSSIYNLKVEYPELGIVTEQDIIYSEEYHIVIGIFTDVTEEEQRRAAMIDRKLEAVEMTQKVIDKQMVVAQEIASLLGETTAETKVTLSKLKKLIESEE